ncbi:4701_t:CDS:2, partial [Racocetra persica]
ATDNNHNRVSRTLAQNVHTILKEAKFGNSKKFLQNISGWTLPLFHGRGIFNYDFGMLPHRRQITTIVGKPIDVVQNDNPTEEEVLEVQRKYIARLYEIWNKYKDIYAKDRK